MPLIPRQFVQRLTNRSSQILSESGSIHKKSVSPGEILFALASSNGTLAFNSLHQFSVVIKPTAPIIKKSRALGGINFTKSSLLAFAYAMKEASSHQHRYIGTEHILFGVLYYFKQNPTQKAQLSKYFTRPLSQKKLDSLCAHLQTIMAGSSKLNPTEENFSAELVSFAHSHAPTDQHSQNSDPVNLPTPEQPQAEINESLLEDVAQDLVEEARHEKQDPVVGRDREAQSLMRVLARRSKHNAILIGKPGVGKTALVKHLAHKIATKQVPKQLAGKPLFSLNLSQLLSGTSYRGEFEAKMKEILEEATERNAILFIDEIHTIIGAGATPGSLDIANILKPVLTDSSLQIIGATTLAEYKQYWERDRALERRFHSILLSELSTSETLEVLRRLSPILEKYYSVNIPSSVLHYVISLTSSHLPNRSLPDKAIDILDEACAHVSSTQQIDSKEIVPNLENRLKESTIRKQNAFEVGDFGTALKELKTQSVLETSAEKENSNNNQNSPLLTVSNDDVAFIVAQFTHSDPQHLLQPRVSHAQAVSENISKIVFGQDAALQEISNQLMNASISQSSPGPIASFFFSGQEGVGKTSTSRAIATHFFGDDNAVIYYDMSEFAEPHSTSRLFGSPPGYVGYSESNTLVDQLRERPRSILVFDNIEKAHPSIIEHLARIMKLSSVSDTNGSEASLSHNIVIAIANISISDLNNIGFDDQPESKNTIKTTDSKPKHALLQSLYTTSSSTISFSPLSASAAAQIASRTLKTLKSQLKTQNIDLSYHGSVARYFTNKYFKQHEGANNLIKGVERDVKKLAVEHLAQKDISSSSVTRIRIAVGEKELVKR